MLRNFRIPCCCLPKQFRRKSEHISMWKLCFSGTVLEMMLSKSNQRPKHLEHPSVCRQTWKRCAGNTHRRGCHLAHRWKRRSLKALQRLLQPISTTLSTKPWTDHIVWPIFRYFAERHKDVSHQQHGLTWKSRFQKHADICLQMNSINLSLARDKIGADEMLPRWRWRWQWR